MTEIKQMYVADDGTMFQTKAEANDYLRRPKIKAELMKLTSGNEELSDWLIENQETVEDAFTTGQIKRVTKSEKKKLQAAIDAIVAADNKDFKFVADNAEAVVESFRWPKVARMTDDEKAVAAKNSLVAASEGNEDLANWAIENQEGVLAAYEAGKVKREVSPKATEALAKWRAEKAKEKAAAEAAAE